MRFLTPLTLLAVVAVATPASADLVAWWKLDEAGGTIAHDQTGVYNGVLSGSAAFVSGGISGNAISLSRATDDLINVGTSFPGFTGADYTLVTWIKTTSTNSDIVASKHESGSFDGYFNAINTGSGYGSPNKAYAYTGGDPSTAPISTTNVTDGQWHQIVGERSGGTALIYVDGLLEATAPAAFSPANAAPFLIGGLNVSGVATGAYTGLIDDVQVYNTALSAGNVSTLFNNPDTAIGFPAATPEPGSVALLIGMGLSSTGLFLRRRRKARKTL